MIHNYYSHGKESVTLISDHKPAVVPNLVRLSGLCWGVWKKTSRAGAVDTYSFINASFCKYIFFQQNESIHWDIEQNLTSIGQITALHPVYNIAYIPNVGVYYTVKYTELQKKRRILMYITRISVSKINVFYHRWGKGNAYLVK
jgi:hypothetical protein